jgi:hypothetical protein
MVAMLGMNKTDFHVIKLHSTIYNHKSAKHSIKPCIRMSEVVKHVGYSGNLHSYEYLRSWKSS